MSKNSIGKKRSRILGQYIRNAELNGWQKMWDDKIAVPRGQQSTVTLWRWVKKDRKRVQLNIDQPHLGNCMLGISGDLGIPIVFERRIRYLDQQQHVLGI